MLKPHDKHEQAVIKRAGRKHAHEEHGGAWKVAFADFCLALLCLFLVLWLMAAREQQAMKEIMLESKGGKQSDGAGVLPEQKGGPRGSLIERHPMPRNGSGNSSNDGKMMGAGQGSPDAKTQQKVSYQSPEDLTKLAKELSKLSAEAGLTSNLQAVVTPYGLRVMLHDTDHQGMFVRGSAIPTGRFRRLLRDMGPLFAQMDNQMLIVGHTDSVQYAVTDNESFSNWTLSSNRAMSARANLLAGGMNSDSVLQVVGMADRAPVDSNNATAGVNRRIELLVLTRGQANGVAAMFGVPKSGDALVGDVDTVEAESAALKKLRQKLAPATRKPLSEQDH
ncbi:chemotaxis protein MotB [Janthinobacterium sp. CG_23.3]|uniref:flagellar motor protein MotB n=1 Tax=unclassified Janthinobacterium TaxID=2610881 RepID=UPI000347018A|nr:flagellar motor protein MotB [Janthinobacterium sp. CG3]